MSPIRVNLTEPPLPESAVGYAEQGLELVPCEPGGKAPLWGLSWEDATNDVEQVRAWWGREPRANIGMSCGGRRIALDVDGEEGREHLTELQARHGPLPDTYTAVTGRPQGGEHLHFERNGTETEGWRYRGLELKTSGHVLLAPSVHPSGAWYWTDDESDAELPELPAWLARSPRPVTAPAVRVSGAQDPVRLAAAGRKALEAELDKLRAHPREPGSGRHTAVFTAAAALGAHVAAGSLAEPLVRAALRDAALGLALVDDAELEHQITNGLAKGAREPYVLTDRPHRSTGDGAGRASNGIPEETTVGPRAKSVEERASVDELIARVRRTVRAYVALPSEHAAIGLALWVLHTWAFDGAHATPYLLVLSPAKRSGKTRLLEVLELLVCEPWRATAPSEAALFRYITQRRPTLLLDEVDAIFGTYAERTEPLRAVLNAGNRPGVGVPRCVGEGAKQRVETFSVWCPKALAGIDAGRLPDTIADRAVRITLRRRRSSETVRRFRHREAAGATADLRAALAAWGSEHAAELADATPELPVELDDRAAEAWEPLLAIADAAGADWPTCARDAALALSSSAPEEESRGVQALGALRAAFADDAVASTAGLLATVNADEQLPFGAYNDGDGLRPRQLAKLLRPFGIRPRGIRLPDGTTPRGYHREDFTDAWERYLTRPEKGAETRRSPSPAATSATSATSAAQSQKPSATDPSEQDPVLRMDLALPSHCCAVADENRLEGPQHPTDDPEETP